MTETMTQWHSLSPGQTAQDLATSAREGLSESEAAERLKQYGPNILSDSEAVRWYHMLARQFANILIWILVMAAGLSFFLGDIIDALAILTIIILNGLLGFLQEWKAETALKGLKKMLSLQCRVIRDGRVSTIPADRLVPGDLVLLESGNRIPADLRLTDGNKIEERCKRACAGVIPLKSCKHSGGKDPADAASINGQDAKTPIFRPSLWNAAFWDCARRARLAGSKSSSLGHGCASGNSGCLPPPCQMPVATQPS